MIVPPSTSERLIVLEEINESTVQIPSGSEGLLVEITVKESHYEFCRKVIEQFIPEKKRLSESRNFSEVKLMYKIPPSLFVQSQLLRGQIDDMRNISMAKMKIKTSICDKVNIKASVSEVSEPAGMERIEFDVMEILLERPMAGSWTLSSSLSSSNTNSESDSSSKSHKYSNSNNNNNRDNSRTDRYVTAKHANIDRDYEVVENSGRFRVHIGILEDSKDGAMAEAESGKLSTFDSELREQISDSNNNIDIHTTASSAVHNEMFIILLIASKILICPPGAVSSLTMKNVLEGQNVLPSFKGHVRRISSTLQSPNTDTTFSSSFSSSSFSSSSSSTTPPHSTHNSTGDSAAPAVCLIPITDMISFRSSSAPPGYTRMQSEDILFSLISVSDNPSGDPAPRRLSVTTHPLRSTEQSEVLHDNHGISSEKSPGSTGFPSLVFRSKVPASDSSYLGGGIEIVITLRPGPLSLRYGLNATSQSSSSSSRSRTSRGSSNSRCLLFGFKKEKVNMYGEKWVSSIAKQKFIITMRCGGLPGLDDIKEESPSPSPAPHSTSTSSPSSTPTSMLFAVSRTLSSIVSTPLSYITAFSLFSAPASASASTLTTSSSTSSSTPAHHSHSEPSSHQYTHLLSATNSNDVIITSSTHVPVDDITLNTANAVFTYVIGGQEVQSDKRNSVKFDSNLSSKSMSTAYEFKIGKREAERSSDEDLESDLDVSASFKWIVRKPTINNFNGDNYLYIRMTPIVDNITDTSKVPKSTAHNNEYQFNTRIKLNKGNVEAEFKREIRAKGSDESNQLDDSTEQGTQGQRRRQREKQMKEYEIKEGKDTAAGPADSAFSQTFDYLATLDVLFTPCPASTCAHGYCALQEGDVQSSTCVCR